MNGNFCINTVVKSTGVVVSFTVFLFAVTEFLPHPVITTDTYKAFKNRTDTLYINSGYLRIKKLFKLETIHKQAVEINENLTYITQ